MTYWYYAYAYKTLYSIRNHLRRKHFATLETAGVQRHAHFACKMQDFVSTWFKASGKLKLIVDDAKIGKLHNHYKHYAIKFNNFGIFNFRGKFTKKTTTCFGRVHSINLLS